MTPQDFLLWDYVKSQVYMDLNREPNFTRLRGFTFQLILSNTGDWSNFRSYFTVESILFVLKIVFSSKEIAKITVKEWCFTTNDYFRSSGLSITQF